MKSLRGVRDFVFFSLSFCYLHVKIKKDFIQKSGRNNVPLKNSSHALGMEALLLHEQGLLRVFHCLTHVVANLSAAFHLGLHS